MKTPSSRLQTIDYKELRSSEIGKAMIFKSEAEASNFLFDLESGDKNVDIAEELSANQIYSGIILASSLSFEVNGKTYNIEPYYNIDEEMALAILQDVQSSIETSLLSTYLEHSESTSEYTPGATKSEVLDVCMTDIVDQYDTPDEVPEWAWIEKQACYQHHRNGEDGIWEFIINISFEDSPKDIPERLQPIFKTANDQSCCYVLFHQGT